MRLQDNMGKKGARMADLEMFQSTKKQRAQLKLKIIQATQPDLTSDPNQQSTKMSAYQFSK